MVYPTWGADVRLDIIDDQNDTSRKHGCSKQVVTSEGARLSRFGLRIWDGAKIDDFARV